MAMKCTGVATRQEMTTLNGTASVSVGVGNGSVTSYVPNFSVDHIPTVTLDPEYGSVVIASPKPGVNGLSFPVAASISPAP